MAGVMYFFDAVLFLFNYNNNVIWRTNDTINDK